MRRFSASSRRAKRSRASSAVKSRKPSVDRLLQLQAPCPARRRRRRCASRPARAPPARRRSSAAAWRCAAGIRSRRSGGHGYSASDPPALARHAVEDLAVVQAEGHVAPELDPRRQQAEAGPDRGARDLAQAESHRRTPPRAFSSAQRPSSGRDCRLPRRRCASRAGGTRSRRPPPRRETGSTAPSTRTLRRSDFQWKQSAAWGLARSSPPLRLSRLV